MRGVDLILLCVQAQCAGCVLDGWDDQSMSRFELHSGSDDALGE